MNTEKLSRSLLEELETLQHVLDDVAGENVDLSKTLSGLDNIDDIPVLHELLSKSEDPALRALDTSSTDKVRATELKAVESVAHAETTRKPLRPRTTRDVLNALHKHIEAHYGNTDLLDNLASKLEAHESAKEARESKALSDSLDYDQYSQNDGQPTANTPDIDAQDFNSPDIDIQSVNRPEAFNLSDPEQRAHGHRDPDEVPDNSQLTFNQSILDDLMEPGEDIEPTLDLNAFDTFKGSLDYEDGPFDDKLKGSMAETQLPLTVEEPRLSSHSKIGTHTSTMDGEGKNPVESTSRPQGYSSAPSIAKSSEPEVLQSVQPPPLEQPSIQAGKLFEATQVSLSESGSITQTSSVKTSSNPFLPQSVLDKLSRERVAAQQSAEEAHKTMQRVAEQKETRLQDQLQQLNHDQKQAVVESLVEEIMPQIKARLHEKLGHMLGIHSDESKAHKDDNQPG